MKFTCFMQVKELYILIPVAPTECKTIPTSKDMLKVRNLVEDLQKSLSNHTLLHLYQNGTYLLKNKPTVKKGAAQFKMALISQLFSHCGPY